MQANYDVNFNTDANAKYKYGFIGTEWDQGGCIGPSGQRTGPASVREAMQLAWGYVRDNRIFDIESNRVVDLNDMMIKDFGNIDDYIVTDWEYSNDRITENVSKVIAEGFTPVVVGGDCSIHYPSVRAVHNACEGNIGVIYMDAHCDFYNDLRKYGNLSHGHPCGNIMKLPRVNGDNVIHFGIRAYEKPEFYDYIVNHGSHVMTPQTFYKLGIAESAKEALAILKKNTEKFVISLDIDVFEAAVAPGSAGPEVGGYSSYDLQEFLKILAPEAAGFVITEVNQTTDFNKHTAILAAKLFNDFMIYNYAANSGNWRR
ncbi:arginase family protein [Anaerotruncus rubiinfantis]|uniref:arginase family protein n=2 Tax=Anaerotruncus rubiinfantis TaxID=1720200 RepID=UPI00082F7BEE|nr:arginase family protein [Anaerotruncus rubiinfantis]